MLVRLGHNKWCVAVTALVLALALVACSPFGKGKGQAAQPTGTPPPTETLLPVLPTFTPIPGQQTPTPTPVPANPAQAQAQPTLTPTAQSPQSPQLTPAQSGEPVSASTPVVKKVTKAPAFGNVIRNGSFEDGFDAQGVALEWTAFSNDHAVYAWVDEIRPIHISHGSHAQLMQIMGPGQPDRFVGIYQTVDVVPGEVYTLTLHGLIRSSTAERSESPYGHRMQWALDESEQTNWYQVNQDWAMWTDLGWNDVQLGADNPPMGTYVLQITPQAARITLYIRGWTKWPILGSEAKFYVDGISLEGPILGQAITVRVMAAVGEKPGTSSMPTTGETRLWIPFVGGLFVFGLAGWEIGKRWGKH